LNNPVSQGGMDASNRKVTETRRGGRRCSGIKKVREITRRVTPEKRKKNSKRAETGEVSSVPR